MGETSLSPDSKRFLSGLSRLSLPGHGPADASAIGGPTLSQLPATSRLCLGGSFNPIHVGHLLCARVAAEKSGYQGVRLIPSGINPHKSSADLAAATDRVALCQLAVAGDPFFIVDDREAKRHGPSYTFDTAAALAAETGQRVAWLIGTDLLARLPSWHRFEELVKAIDFVVMRRAGHPIDMGSLHPAVAKLAEHAVVVPAIEVSSTALRQRLRLKQTIEHATPPACNRYIINRNLYL